MRILLVAHGFPPEERTGVEGYTEALALRLADAGHRVEVFVPRPDPTQADLAMRRELRSAPGGATIGVTRIATNTPPRDPEQALDPPGVAECFGDFLDRERPEVVHLQHVIKLGLGLVEEAAARGIPTVYTAHDYYGLCHRYTLLRPDLTVCRRETDPEACARCDLALAVLNDAAGGQDYQMGLAPEDLDDAVARRLVGTLEGDPAAEGGFDPGAWEQAVTRRAALDARRREVFRSVDLLLAPSRFLGERLARSLADGGDPVPVAHLPYGTEAEDLVALRAEAPAGAGLPDRPLRLGYLGGLAKQKGVEVLLEAFGRLRERHGDAAELHLHGYSSDAAWVERLRAEAGAVGAAWHGGYERRDLPAVLAGVDLVVVPSTWYENYPIVIREALAAGRPVVTSDLGALPESVRDGIDGALFEPGSAEDLARVLDGVLADPDLLPRWVAGIDPVHPMAAQADELVERYGALVEAAAAERAVAEDLGRLPASMRPFVGRLAELEALPTRDLFTAAMAGLGRLADGLGVAAADRTADRVLSRALASGDEAQRSLRDQRREVEWLRASLAGATEARVELERKAAWTEETLADRDAALDALAGERDEAASGRAALEERAAWLEGEVAGRDEALAARGEQLGEVRRALDGQTEELDWRRGQVEQLEQDKAQLEALITEQAAALGLREGRIEELAAGLEAERDERARLEELLHRRLHEVAEVGRHALAGQEHAMTQGLAPLFEALDRASGHGADPSRASLEEGLAQLVTAVERGLDRLAVLEGELAWRRTEMAGMVEQAGRFPLRLLVARSGLGRRARSWADAAPAASEGRAPDPEAGS